MAILEEGDVPPLPVAPDIEERLARFIPVRLEADLGDVAEGERRVLAPLVAAARLMDEVFLRQAAVDNPRVAVEVAALPGARGAAAKEYFAINFGPWDRLAEREPFVGRRPHPPGAGYYPEDMRRDELEAWLSAHEAERESLTSTTTVVRRRGKGLVAIPYAEEYAAWLRPAAGLLREAAAASGDASLRHFLELRAGALLDDDYLPSELAWMDLASPVELTLGPYETYEDELCGYKAAFEAFITVSLPDESRALAEFKERLPWLESNLPVPDAVKNPRRGTESPIRVADLFYSAGDTRAGVQTLAFNLPNDERVREARGSKKVLLRNTMRAKFERILGPVAGLVLPPDEAAAVSFEAYLKEILHHELAHGLGPGTITLGGRRTEVRLELKELYATLEEAKADVMGVYNILALIGRGEMDGGLLRSLLPTYVAGLFRAARFGVDEAHGQGVIAQYNYLLVRGALAETAGGRVAPVPGRFAGVIRDLLAEILTLQATGDHAGTRAFLEAYGKPTREFRSALGRLSGLPVDIRPLYAPDSPAS